MKEKERKRSKKVRWNPTFTRARTGEARSFFNVVFLLTGELKGKSETKGLKHRLMLNFFFSIVSGFKRDER